MLNRVLVLTKKGEGNLLRAGNLPFLEQELQLAGGQSQGQEEAVEWELREKLIKHNHFARAN